MFKKTVNELFRCKGSRLFVILMSVNYALSCVMPALNGGFVDFLVTNRDPSRVVWFAAFVASIGISASFMSYAMGVNVSRVILEMTTRLMGATCESFERGPLEKGEQADSSYTTQRVYADSNAVSSFVVNNFLTIGLNNVLIVFIFIILFSINPVFLALSTCSLGAYFILFRVLKKPLYNSSLANKEGLSKLFASVSGELSQLFDIKCDGAYDQSARTLKGIFEGYYPIYMKASRVSNLATSSDGLISSVFRGALLVISGMEILNGRMSIGEFTMVNSYYSMAFGCFKYYLNYFKSYQDARASFDRLEALSEGAEDRGTISVGHVESISLSNIAYRYAGKPYLYRDLSVEVERGKTYAITGPNGCGKSTFLKVLLGLYSAGGHRTLGSVPYEELDMETIRHDLFAVCPQKLFIPNETVEHYLERASIRGTGEHLCELVPSFCRTVESLKGKNCRDLSGGEYRKLRIISALCRQPEVLVFDEPTNDLDEESRREFTEYVSRNPFNQLILVVSHDQDLILACDKKLDLNFDSKDGQC